MRTLNESYEELSPSYGDSSMELIILIYITVLTCFVGALLNGLVCVMFMMDRSLLKKPANILIFSITMSDFLQSLTASPMLVVVLLQGKWVLGKEGCCIYAFLMTWFGLVSITNLSALAVERYISLKNVMTNCKSSVRGGVIAVTFLWGYSLFWASMPLLGWSHYVLDSSKLSCSVKWHSNQVIDLSYNIGLLVGCFVIPVSVIIVSYCLLSHLIRSLTKRAKTSWGKHSFYTRNTIRKEKMMRRLVLTMIGAFFFAWTPYAMISLIAMLRYSELVSPSVETVAAFTAKSSTLYNPIIYVFIYKDFKLAILRLIRKDSDLQQVSSTIEITLRRHSCRNELKARRP